MHAPDIIQENRELRVVLLRVAIHHQGANSKVGRDIALVLDLPFPLRLKDIKEAEAEIATPGRFDYKS